MSALGRATAPPQIQVGVVTNSLCLILPQADRNQNLFACEPPPTHAGKTLPFPVRPHLTTANAVCLLSAPTQPLPVQ